MRGTKLKPRSLTNSIHRLTTVSYTHLDVYKRQSSTHVKSLAEEVEFQFKEKGVAPIRTEGFNTQNWFILDYALSLIHI